MSFIHVKSLLMPAATRVGISHEAKAALVVRAANNILGDKFGNAPVGSAPRVMSLAHGVLTISCSSSAQAAAIRLREQEFLRMLEERFGHGVIESFRFIS